MLYEEFLFLFRSVKKIHQANVVSFKDTILTKKLPISSIVDEAKWCEFYFFNLQYPLQAHPLLIHKFSTGS